MYRLLLAVLLPLLLSAVDLPTGKWEGTLAGSLRLILNLQDKGSVLTSVDQGNSDLTIDTMEWKPDGSLSFEAKQYGISWQGKLNAAGDALEGTFTQGAAKLPLTFKRPGRAPEHTLTAITRGKMTLEPCWAGRGYTKEAYCGKLEVFENRAAKSGRKIALSVMILPSKSTTPLPDPVVAIAGGPGQSSVEAFPAASVFNELRKTRDVVLTDQRGTGGSNPLPCAFTAPTHPETYFAPLMPEDKVRTCLAELEKKADLKLYTTSIAMDDLEDIRQALGYDQINLYGGSYGTRAALVYLRQHEKHVRTVTIKGVAPPGYRLPISLGPAIQESLIALFTDCAADTKCSEAYPKLREEFEGVLKALDEKPAEIVVNGAPATIVRGVFVDRLRQILYIPETASMSPAMIHEAAKGDFSRFSKLVVLLSRQTDDQVARGMFMSVICSEDMPYLKPDEIRRNIEGTYLGDYRWRQHEKACSLWPKAKIPRSYLDPIASAKPVLMISGDEDPATPTRVATEAARRLTNSRNVAIRYGTHGTASPCIDKLTVEFIEAGTHKDLDSSCTAQIRRPPFLIAK